MLRFRVLMLTLCFGMIVLGAARPQDFDSPLIAYKYQRVVKAILDNYTKNASEKDRQILKGIKIKVDGADFNVYGVRAQIIDGHREIVIPIGFISATYFVNVALADTWRFNRIGQTNTDDLSDYVEYVAGALKASDIATRTGGDIPGIMNFCVFRKLAEEECAKRDRDPDLLKIYALVEYSSLSFVIGHEIGHHVRGHLGNGKPLFLTESEVSSQQMETEADMYSTKTMVRSDQIVDGAMATMFLFSYLKGEAALNDNSGDHPHPLCRWIDMLEVQQKELPKSQILMRLLRNQGSGLEDEKAAIDALRAAVPHCTP